MKIRIRRLLVPVFWLLAALGVGITPYFLPMAAIFALLLADQVPRMKSRTLA